MNFSVSAVAGASDIIIIITTITSDRRGGAWRLQSTGLLSRVFAMAACAATRRFRLRHYLTLSILLTTP